MKPSTSNAAKPPIAILTLFGFCIFMQCFAFAMRSPVGEPPDEMAHLSYVADAQHDLMPNYRDGTIAGSGTPNYLSHPPAYYSALALAANAFDLNPYRHYRVLRALSALIFSVGFFLVLLTLRELGASVWGTAASALLALIVPMFGYLGGSVNNDTLAYASVGCFLFGFARYQFISDRLNAGNIILLGVGAAGALLTKATTAAFLVFFSIGALAMYSRHLRSEWKQVRLAYLAGAVGLIVAAYYLPTLLTYGTPFPKPGPLYSSPAPATPLTHADYTLKFFASMWDRLPVIMSHASRNPYSEIGQAVFYILIILPVAALLWALSSGDLTRENRRFLLSVLIGAMGFAVVHFMTAYGAYLGHGKLSGIQPRYYAFLLPILFGAYSAAKSPWLREALPLIIIFGAIVLFWGAVPELF